MVWKYTFPVHCVENYFQYVFRYRLLMILLIDICKIRINLFSGIIFFLMLREEMFPCQSVEFYL